MKLMSLNYFLLYFYTSASVAAVNVLERSRFINEFLDRHGQPALVISAMNSPIYETLQLCKELSKGGKSFKARACFERGDNRFKSECPRPDTIDKQNKKYDAKLPITDNFVYLADLNNKQTVELLLHSDRFYRLSNPARWILFYDSSGNKNDKNITIYNASSNSNLDNDMEDIAYMLEEVNLAINTEVYIVIEKQSELIVYLVHRRWMNLPLIWEEYGTWEPMTGFDRTHPESVLALRRRDLQGLRVNCTSVILDNRSLGPMVMEDYMDRDVDSMSKMLYYLVVHLVEWVNGTRYLSTTDSWGYLKPDGTFDGMVQEFWEGTADIAGTVLFPMKGRLPAVNYISPPAEINIRFIFKKPPLASVTNIYSLPFSSEVWLSLGFLVLVSSIALFFTSYREMQFSNRRMTVPQRLSQGFHDTLCLVFQQGTATDPISISGREILFLGMLSFMFLFTAYSANIVALLQSVTNDINSIEALLKSPLRVGAEDFAYSRQFFSFNEKRPIHRQLWLKKGAPLGEKFFIPTAEGIRRVREGMFAFHVEPTAGFDLIQATFFEHEKCSFGVLKYIMMPNPIVATARDTHIRDVLRIGVLRILEGGVQSRSNRRLLPKLPRCPDGMALFTEVSLTDVAPGFICLLALYGVAVAVLVLEVAVHWRESHKKNFEEPFEDFEDNGVYEFNE